jgi:hypothetical protein
MRLAEVIAELERHTDRLGEQRGQEKDMDVRLALGTAQYELEQAGDAIRRAIRREAEAAEL